MAKSIQRFGIVVSAFFWLGAPPDLFAESHQNEVAAPPVQAGNVMTPRPATLNNSSALLTGLYVARRYYGNMTVQFLDGEFWVPWKKFLSISGFPALEEHDGIVAFSTTIGNILFDTVKLRAIDGQRYVSFRMLDEVFKVSPSFDQSLFAVKFRIPWVPSASSSSTRPVPLPDVYGPGTALSFVHAQYQYANDSGLSSYRNLDVQSGGRAIGGVWDMDFQGDPNARMDLCRFHWTLLGEHTAFRLGTATTESSTLLAARDFTGLQFGWSNRDVRPYFDQPFTSVQDAFMIFNSAQMRNIEGNGPPAGIAELRFDGKAVARQTILMDGRFSFPKVEMGMDFRRTEVYLYKSSILEKPAAVLDFTQSVSNRSLEANTILASGGIGTTGNPLLRNESRSSGFPISYAHLQYGVSRWLTVETAAQAGKSIQGSDILAGAVLSIGSKWNASLYAASSNEHCGTDFTIERRGKRSDLLLGSTRYEQGFQSDEQSQLTRQFLRFSWNALENFNFSLFGRREESPGSRIEYLRPGGSFFLRPGFRFSITPDYDQNGAYRYEAAYYGSSTLSANVSYDSKKIDTNLLWQSTGHINLRLSNQYYTKTNDRLSTAYLDWYPTDTRKALFELIASRSRAQTGASISYHRSVQAGFDVALSYQYNIPNTLQLDLDRTTEDVILPGKHAFFCSLTWDFGWSGRRLKPISRSSLTLNRGGIAGELQPEHESNVEKSKVRNIGILVNGYRMVQNRENGSCFIGNLKPGLYRVSVDPESLPLDVSPDQKTRIVEVRGCGITKVNIPLHAEYGISGQLSDEKGNGIAGVLVKVRRDGQQEPAGSGLTNDFGYYRINGLRNGLYVIYVEDNGQGKMTIPVELPCKVSGKYEFDLDMKLPGNVQDRQ
ncbi:MAG: carboxypeptidase regulatory-like domain-containing protein [Chlorobiaceae bacterium]|nr:carboxypeptidase regulatory-like domain-containing protein [Chlorobiaceae bacterium]